MPLPHARVLAVLPLALVAGLAACAVGCGGDGVQVSTVPKTDAPKPADKGGPEPVGEYRILGAIFPADDPAWFFKFPGSTEQLAKYDADFDKLVASVSLPANGPIEFTPPEGWKRGPGEGQFGFATVGTPDGKHKVTVTPSKGGVQGNLARWAEQLGVPFGPGDAAKVTKPVEAKGVKGLRVDLRGPKAPPTSGMGGPMMGGK